MGLENLNSGQAKACPVIVPRWESGHEHLVMEQVFSGSPLLRLRLQSSGPVWRMAGAVIMGDLPGAPRLVPALRSYRAIAGRLVVVRRFCAL